MEWSSDESLGRPLPGKPRRSAPQQSPLDEAAEGTDHEEGDILDTVVEKMKISQNFVGWLIGRGGSTIDQIRAETSTNLQFNQRTSGQGFSILRITGSHAGVLRAKELVEEKMQQPEWECEGGGRAWSGSKAYVWSGEGGARRRSRSPLAHTSWSQAPAASLPGPASQLLRTVLNALLGKWHGRTADGTAQCYEVAPSLMPSRPNGAQLACRTVVEGGAQTVAARPIRYEGGDIFLGERSRLLLDWATERQLAWVDERDPGVRFLWKRGWSTDPLGPGDCAGGYATEDGGQAETSGAEFDMEGEDDFPTLATTTSTKGVAAQEGSHRRHMRFPKATSTQLAMRFQ